MKSNKTVLSNSARQNARHLFKALLLGLVACNRQVKAQAILAPPPPSPDTTPTAMQSAGEMNVFAPPPATESQPLKWGAFVLRPHPYYQFMYADGIQANTNLVNSTIQEVSVGALLQMGNNWTLDYSPLWTIYSSDQFQNTFGQSARLVGGMTYNDWVLGLSQNYVDSSAPSAQTGTQLREHSYTTAANGAYTINSQMSLDLEAEQNIVSADQFASYNEWSTLDWLNYQFWPRLNVAVGAGGGYDDMSSSPDMTFEQFQGRVNWRATDKISFQIHGGAEDRQFIKSPAADLVSPVYDATIQYQPFEQTQIAVTGSRTVGGSVLQNEVTDTTAVNASLNQRLLGRLFLNVNGGYQKVRYVSALNTGTAIRTDDFYSLNTRLSRSFLKRGTVAVFYQISRDNSSQPGFSFTSHQVGFQVGFAY